MNRGLPSHDDFIKSIFADKQVAIDYLKAFLPPFVSRELDFSTMEHLSETYLSDELKKSISDIVYSCHLNRRKSRVKICLLIEHKSHPDRNTPVQLGGYIYGAYQKQILNDEPLALVIPILLYHGREKWEYRTLKDLFHDLNDQWKQFLPDFGYVYNDLGILDDMEIKKLHNKFLAASFLALKHSAQKAWLTENARKIFVLASQDPKGLRKELIIYLVSRSELQENILNSLPEPVKTDVMNTLNIYIEKGRKKGFEEGIEKGIKKGIEKGIEKGKEEGKEFVIKNLISSGKFNTAEIANLADVPVTFVKKLSASLKKK